MSIPGSLAVKNLPAIQETQVWSLSQEDALEEEMAPHSSILAWEIPWREEPGRLQSLGSKESYMTEPPPHMWSDKQPSQGGGYFLGSREEDVGNIRKMDESSIC